MPLTTKCVKQTTKKYTSAKRKSPPYPANERCGEIYEGNDGNTYESVADKKGVCKWKKYHQNREKNMSKIQKKK